MKPTMPRIQAPSSAMLIQELRQREERARAGPWTAVLWLTALALPLPFVPYVGASLGIAIFGPLDLLFTVLAIVLFCRGAVMRGLCTVALAVGLYFWLGCLGGALLLDWLIANHHLAYPWPRSPVIR